MLTKRRKETLDFVIRYTKEEGYNPSLEEIRRHLGLSSVSTAHYHIKKLKESGYLEKTDNQLRALGSHKDKTALNTEQKIKVSSSVPVYGTANAGTATVFAEENLSGYVKIPDALRIKKDNLFAVQARGDSMNQANIGGKNLEDGDWAVIDPKCQNPKNGDYVLSIIDNCANLKKFEKERKTGHIKLVSESTNKSHKPIYISSEDNYMVNGKIVAVVKK